MAYSTTRSTFFCPAGTKWYWEFVPTTGYNYASCGITTNSAAWDVNPGGTTDGHGVGFYDTELDVDGTRNMSAITAWASGDIVSFAYDVDNDEIKYYINGSLSYTYSSVPTSTDGPYSPTFGDFGGAVAATINVNFGADSSFGGLKTSGSAAAQDDNEKGDFYYEPPSGYLALCEDNLSTPEIKLPESEAFNTVLYTGDGSTQAVSGVGFQPDFVWLKNRNSTGSNMAYDSVRGATYYLHQNETLGQTNGSNLTSNLQSFDSDGFTVIYRASNADNTNRDTYTYASWNWKAGGAPTADNSAGAGAVPTAGSVKIDGSNLGSALAGSIAATRLSANTTNGFSIVTWTGNLTSGATVAHGLSQAPDYIIVKVLNASRNWGIGSDHLSGSTWENYLQFTIGAELDNVNMFNDTAPSSSVFTIGNNTDINGSGDTYVAYCFHSVEGYSKAGMWTGNGNADGPFAYTGFKPAFLMLKDYTSGTGENWRIRDSVRNPYNVVNDGLRPSANSAEDVDSSGSLTDFLSNGFKLRNADNNNNGSGRTYLYLAFAESPFKYSNAR